MLRHLYFFSVLFTALDDAAFIGILVGSGVLLILIVLIITCCCCCMMCPQIFEPCGLNCCAPPPEPYAEPPPPPPQYYPEPPRDPSPYPIVLSSPRKPEPAPIYIMRDRDEPRREVRLFIKSCWPIDCQKAPNCLYFVPYDVIQMSQTCGPNTYQTMYGETLDLQCQRQ